MEAWRMFSGNVKGAWALVMALVLALACLVPGAGAEETQQQVQEPAQSQSSVPYQDMGGNTAAGETVQQGDSTAQEPGLHIYRVSFTDINGEIFGWVDVPQGHFILELEGFPHVDGLVFQHWFDVRDETASPFVFGVQVTEDIYLAPYYVLQEGAYYGNDGSGGGYYQESVPALNEEELRNLVAQILQTTEEVPAIAPEDIPLMGDVDDGAPVEQVQGEAQAPVYAEDGMQVPIMPDAVLNDEEQINNMIMGILDISLETPTTEDTLALDPAEMVADIPVDETEPEGPTEEMNPGQILGGDVQEATSTVVPGALPEETALPEGILLPEQEVKPEMTPLADSILAFLDINTQEDGQADATVTPEEGAAADTEDIATGETGTVSDDPEAVAEPEATGPDIQELGVAGMMTADMASGEPTDEAETTEETPSDEPSLTGEEPTGGEGTVDTAEDTLPTEDSIPEIPSDAVMAEAPLDSMVMITFAFEGDRLSIGAPVTLSAELINFPESAVVSFQWQNDASGTFTDVPGANGRSYSFIADESNVRCNWKVRTVYWEAASSAE